MKWGGAIAVVLLLTAWGASELRYIYLGSTRWGVELTRGYVEVVRIGHGTYHGPGSHVSTYDIWNRDRMWWIRTRDSYARPWTLPFTTVAVPLWMPTVIAMVCSGVAWRRDRLARLRDRGRLCHKCKYDRTGLAPGANCPECGAVPPEC